VRDTDDF
jgi:hypothetical protein